MAASPWTDVQSALSQGDVRRTARPNSFRDAPSSAVTHATVFFYSPEPDPEARIRSGPRYASAMDFVTSALAPLRALQFDWDSYGGRPIDPVAAEFVQWLVPPLLVQDVPMPALVPGSGGGISLEWHRPGLELVVTHAGGDADATVFLADDQSGDEWEEDYAAAHPKLAEALARFLPET